MNFSSLLSGCYKDGVAQASCLPQLIIVAINAAFFFSGIVGVAVIIFAGIKYVMSAGDAKQIQGAQHTLQYGLIGLVVVLFSILLVNMFGTFTGVTCLSLRPGQSFGFTSCQ